MMKRLLTSLLIAMMALSVPFAEAKGAGGEGNSGANRHRHGEDQGEIV